jgi:hypothetical protein
VSPPTNMGRHKIQPGSNFRAAAVPSGVLSVLPDAFDAAVNPRSRLPLAPKQL